MSDLLVALGDNLMFADTSRAARTPRHDIVALVDHPPFPALLEERPDLVVVLIGEGVIGTPQLRGPESADELFYRPTHPPAPTLHREALGGIQAHPRGQLAQHGRVFPVHPHAKPHRLLPDLRRVRQDTLFAEVHERPHAELLDVALAAESQVAFDVHFDPKALAVEAILVALSEPAHRLVALKEILIGPPPGVVHPHGVVGGDRAIQERPPLFRSFVAAEVLAEDVVGGPPRQDLALKGREVNFRRHRAEAQSGPTCWHSGGRTLTVGPSGRSLLVPRRGRRHRTCSFSYHSASTNKKTHPVLGRANRGTTQLPALADTWSPRESARLGTRLEQDARSHSALRVTGEGPAQPTEVKSPPSTREGVFSLVWCAA